MPGDVGRKRVVHRIDGRQVRPERDPGRAGQRREIDHELRRLLVRERERIVQIRLTDEEGGLNLNMDDNTIRRIVEKGDAAGRKLLDFQMDQHQWVRFRVLMKQMESSLDQMYKALRSCEFYMHTVGNPPLPDHFPYKSHEQWCHDARRQLEEMSQVFDALKPRGLFAESPSPMPEPVLRVMPEI